jgi:hypothetical protein
MTERQLCRHRLQVISQYDHIVRGASDLVRLASSVACADEFGGWPPGIGNPPRGLGDLDTEIGWCRERRSGSGCRLCLLSRPRSDPSILPIARESGGCAVLYPTRP